MNRQIAVGAQFDDPVTGLRWTVLEPLTNATAICSCHKYPENRHTITFTDEHPVKWLEAVEGKP